MNSKSNQTHHKTKPSLQTQRIKSRKPIFEKKKATIMSASGVSFSLSFLLILANVISPNESSPINQANGSSSLESKSEEMVPLMEMKTVMMMNETRRKLNSFQICAVCTCCGGAKGLCLPSPCCYAINCNIPNKPFGFCSFTPQTCNCLRCHL